MVVSDRFSSANIERILRIMTITYMGNASSKGENQDFLKVGTKARLSTVVRMTIAHNGSLVKYHRGRDNIAVIKKNQSLRVILISALFK